MEPLYSLLVFPQSFKQGRLNLNVLLLPRNINLFQSIDDKRAFVDAAIDFTIKVIDSLDGLPLTTNVTVQRPVHYSYEYDDKRAVIEEVIRQMEQTDNLKISDDENENKDTKASDQIKKFENNNVTIRKYLPLSYRNAFNFVQTKTRFAIQDDEYACTIKNKDKKQTDTVTKRDYISWGKLVAFLLRNPILAERAGLIYKGYIDLDNNLLKNGGWVFADFTQDASLAGISTLQYAARIPKLSEDRHLFTPVLFPVKNIPDNNSNYDPVIQEAILYNDGYAKIVHGNQPVNQDLLQETDTSNPPLKDIGIRLGWDDEQLAIWYNRQLRQKEEITNTPIDAPIGIFGYKIDVRRTGDTDWRSQNAIVANQPITLGNSVELLKAGDALELPFEVHPSSHGETLSEGFWLPMYNASWSGKSLVIPDKEAQEIHQLEVDKVVSSYTPDPNRPDDSLYKDNARDTIPKQVFYPYSQDAQHALPLEYGEDYDFRVRLTDLTGGSPDVTDPALNGGANPIGKIHFRRHIAPGTLDILNIKEFYDTQIGAPTIKDPSLLNNLLDGQDILRIKRPLLGYPSVLYTGKYSDCANRLKQKINQLPTPNDPKKRVSYEIGLEDPDVKLFKVRVEVRTLEMDNELSLTGQEPYIQLYEKKFDLEYDENSQIYDQTFSLKIVYQDFSLLQYQSGIPDLGEKNELILPSSRELRLTLTPLLASTELEVGYASDFAMEGKPLILNAYRPAVEERNILSPIKGGIRAFYLQPENPGDGVANGGKTVDNLHIKATKNKTSIEMMRLADALDLSVKNLTLEGNKGQRIQFGIHHDIRHSLGPDSSSIMFSTQNELFNHWLVALDYSLLRDWAWKALKPVSFIIKRKYRLERETSWQQEKTAGIIQVKDIANIQMLDNADREKTRILFLDVVDPEQINGQFPQEILVHYTIIAQFEDGFAVPELTWENEVHLPVTMIPAQIPQLISAGIAMTPYKYDTELYRYSEKRLRYLWLEFKEPPLDPNDTYYVRVLASAPDPYLCRIDKTIQENISNDLEFMLNEEYIREIIPNMENDYASMGVMQEMIPQIDESSIQKPKVFLLPLPNGLHADSDELFGFFTYEVRLGHKKETWSTAQGRYGRPLRVNGVQHPVPELVCSAYRTETGDDMQFKHRYLEISAPHASAVLNGKNVAAFPPQTSLWYLLYTQVMQADGVSFRNLLIDSGPMPYEVKKSGLDGIGKIFFKEGGVRLGKARITLHKIQDKLEMIGLPRNNPLSVIAVEMFPLENRWQWEKDERKSMHMDQDSTYVNLYNEIKRVNPLIEDLGKFRIYRTSVLVPITETCCEDC